jgi:SAM-dependent methyltransferase
MQFSPNLVYRNCMLCGTNNIKFFFKHKHIEVFPKGELWTRENVYKICRYCYFIYTDPDLNEKDRVIYYRNLLIEDPNKHHKESSRSIIHFNIFRNLVNKNIINSNSKILEIGCGTGNLLKNIINFYKLKKDNVFGIELSKILLNFLKKKKIFNILNKLPKKNKYFNLIILDNVFEHFADPNLELKKIHYLLINNGFVYISVPNILKTRQNIGDPFNHECNYILENLTYLFKKNGFKILKYSYKNYWLNLLAIKETMVPNLKFSNKDRSLCRKKVIKLKKFIFINKKNKELRLKKIKNKLFFNKKDLKIILYGASNQAAILLYELDLKRNIIGFSDSNKDFQSKYRLGYFVYKPEQLLTINFDYILISSAAFQEEIRKKLILLGIDKKKILTIY